MNVLPSQMESMQRTVAQPAEESDVAGRILLSVFELLDRCGIRYCVLHGYEAFPQRVKSDVDCVIDPRVTPGQIFALLHRNKASLGAEVVRHRGYYFVLACRNSDGSHSFLTLDLAIDCQLDGLPFYSGYEVLDGRRRHHRFWVPAAHIEFGCLLARSVAKAALSDARAQKLSSLYRQDPAGCARQVVRFWGMQSSGLIISAARSGDWRDVTERLSDLRTELRRRRITRAPLRFAADNLHAFANRMSRLVRPEGLSVVLLGPDGAGKSSLIEALSGRLDAVFSCSDCWGFAPALHRLLNRRRHPTDRPHALPSRSLLTSLVRAAYWFFYYTLGYVMLHVARARSTLVLYDRHFVDILVDAKRYRYGGPRWITRLIWRVMPKPDLIVLLDAAPEVLQSRKQEVSFEETTRQREAYLSLARTMANAHVVDASQTPEQVACDVSEVILRHLAARVARRRRVEARRSRDAGYAAASTIGGQVLQAAKEK